MTGGRGRGVGVLAAVREEVGPGRRLERRGLERPPIERCAVVRHGSGRCSWHQAGHILPVGEHDLALADQLAAKVRSQRERVLVGRVGGPRDAAPRDRPASRSARRCVLSSSSRRIANRFPRYASASAMLRWSPAITVPSTPCASRAPNSVQLRIVAQTQARTRAAAACVLRRAAPSASAAFAPRSNASPAAFKVHDEGRVVGRAQVPRLAGQRRRVPMEVEQVLAARCVSDREDMRQVPRLLVGPRSAGEGNERSRQPAVRDGAVGRQERDQRRSEWLRHLPRKRGMEPVPAIDDIVGGRRAVRARSEVRHDREPAPDMTRPLRFTPDGREQVDLLDGRRASLAAR